MIEQMHSLGFEFADDGLLHLEQDGGSGQVDQVWLHPSQLRLLCERAGLLAITPLPAIDKRILARFERLLDGVEYLADNIWLDEICERLGDGLAYRIGITAAADELRDLVETLGGAHDAVPRDTQGTDAGQEADTAAACHERPDANSASRQGRPPIGEKKTADAGSTVGQGELTLEATTK